MDPRWKKSLKPEENKPTTSSKKKIRIQLDNYFSFYLETHLAFSDLIRFAVHVPAAGLLIMMYHPVQGHTGLTFCRPGDAAWTKLDNPVTHDDDRHQGRSSYLSFVDFAYLDGKMFATDVTGATAVFDADTRDVLDLVLVDAPPDTANFCPKLLCASADADEQLDRLHFVALPDKLILVRVRVRSPVPESFYVFQLKTDDDGQGISWCEMMDGIGAGIDLFLDDHHATFFGPGCGPGNRIYYYVPNCHYKAWTPLAYCYSLLNGKLECVYRPPEETDHDVEYSTRPSWFLP